MQNATKVKILVAFFVRKQLEYYKKMAINLILWYIKRQMVLAKQQFHYLKLYKAYGG